MVFQKPAICHFPGFTASLLKQGKYYAVRFVFSVSKAVESGSAIQRKKYE
jgi:hypothetical protein